MITSIYKEMANLSSRKTTTGLAIFNSLIKSGLVRFLSTKEETKTVTVSIDELQKARAVRGPVDEPCDPYEWENEYIDL